MFDNVLNTHVHAVISYASDSLIIARFLTLFLVKSAIYFREECYIFPRGVLYISERSAIYFREECYIFPRGVLYISERSATLKRNLMQEVKVIKEIKSKFLVADIIYSERLVTWNRFSRKRLNPCQTLIANPLNRGYVSSGRSHEICLSIVHTLILE